MQYNSENNKFNFFQTLPDEILLRIFTRLFDRDLLNIAWTNSTWRELAFDSRLWINYTLVQLTKLGRSDILEALIEKGADIKSKGVNNTTLLHFAAMNGHLDCITLLSSKGAILEARDFYGLTPLCYAIRAGQLANAL